VPPTQPIPVAINISINVAGQQAASQAASSIQNLGTKAKTAARDFASLAGAYTALLTVKYVAGAMGAVIKPAIEMQTAMTKLGAYTRATAGEMAAYKKTAYEVASATAFNQKEIADGMLQLFRATGSASSARKLMGETAAMAQASFGAMSLETTSKMVGELTKGFAETAGSTEGARLAMDKMTAGALAAGVPIENYSRIVGRMGLAAKAGGQNMDEAIQSFLLINRSLRSPEMAVSAMLRISEELGSKKTQQALRAIGVEVLDSSGKIRNFSTITQELFQRQLAAPERFRNAINQAFTARSQLGVQSLVSNAPMLAMLQQTMGSASGTLARLKAEQEKTPEIQIQKLTEAFYGLAVEIGTRLLPSLMKGVKLVTELVEAFTANKTLMSVTALTVEYGGYAAAIWGAVAAARALVKILAVANAFAWGRSLAGMGGGAAVTAAASAAGTTAGAAAAAGTAATAAGVGLGSRIVGFLLSRAAMVVGAGAVGMQASKEMTIGWRQSRSDDLYKYYKGKQGWKDSQTSYDTGKYGIERRGDKYYDKAREMADKEAGIVRTEQELEDIKANRLKTEQAVALMVLETSTKFLEKITGVLREAKKIADYMQLGSKEWKDALSEYKSAMNYTPEVVDWPKIDKTFTQMGKTEKTLRGMGDPDSVRAADIVATAGADMGEFNRIRDKSMKEVGITTKEALFQQQIAKRVKSALDYAEQLRPGSTRGIGKEFKKEAGKLADRGSEGNVANARILRGLAQGKSLLTGEQETTTPYNDAASQNEPTNERGDTVFGKLWKKVVAPKTELETAKEGWTRGFTGVIGALNRMAGKDDAVETIRVLESTLKQLKDGIPVNIQKRDPMTSDSRRAGRDEYEY
jgi:TP901 family phage tail tape measure protein